jgi:ribonuclease E
MSKQMLIDAAHSEETRVAVIDEQNLLIDYDFKSTFKHTIKGNIYLAKVARVEPSLQAAFIEYGGNRHGFLAFSEIHPDYFRIPVADRERIAAELRGLMTPETIESANADETEENANVEVADTSYEELIYKMPISTVGGDLPLPEEDNENYFYRLSLHRRYKIQEVIHRNQILLVQVVKEERGGKGAALTTYLSLPGRYCVLMPNSPHSGGISRKISEPHDRKRLRKILDALEVPEGMGLIIRTAGKERTKSELKRDAEYLMRLWNTIRETTLQSIAPTLIYQEDDIIKRAIRDLYSKDIEKILVEGEEGYKIARNFMRTLMPSHVKRIQLYKNDKSPLFHYMGIESQINQIHEPQVYLPSGGSIVIHPTEALVSIDINSGRSTRERHIEETATKTNLEAAVEIARQVRLRDLAGLIVIDFIDMDEPRNVAAVERKVKEVFRNDRARVQVGKISPFGLLELSRQRLAPSILETSAYPCPHCHATGYIRSTESKALQVLRAIEEEAILRPASEVMVSLPSAIASYIFNKKRHHLSTIESRHQLTVQFEFNDHIEHPGFIISSIRRSATINGQIFEENHKVHMTASEHQGPIAVVDEPKNQDAEPCPQAGATPTLNSNKATSPNESNQGEMQRPSHQRRRKQRRRRQQSKSDTSSLALPEQQASLQEQQASLPEQQAREAPLSGEVMPIPLPAEASPLREIIEPEVIPRDFFLSDNIVESLAKITASGNTTEKRRRNRRRHHRRHGRQVRKQAESDTEPSSAPSTSSSTIHYLNTSPTVIPLSENQNHDGATIDLVQDSQQQTLEETPLSPSSYKKRAKGWWQKLLE